MVSLELLLILLIILEENFGLKRDRRFFSEKKTLTYFIHQSSNYNWIIYFSNNSLSCKQIFLRD